MNKILKPTLSLILPKNYYLNKNILITGGGSGLGKQMALTYSKLGGNVYILGRKETKLKDTCLEIEELSNNKPKYFSVDVRDTASINSIADELETNNALPEIVVNNAAGNFICPSEYLTTNGWNSIIDIVLKGTMNMSLAFGKRLINHQQQGIFVNISTTYAETGSAYVLPSSVAKAGCDNLTKSLSAEWGKYGIRFLSVAPGPIYTDGAFSRLDPSNKFSEIAKKNLPLGRLGEKEEIANLVSYLTTNENNWMTGQIINFDGGEVVGNSGEFNLLRNLKPEEWKMFAK